MKVVICGSLVQDRKAFLGHGARWEYWAINGMHSRTLAYVPTSWWRRCFNLHRYRHLLRDWNAGVYIEGCWASAHREIPYYVIDRWPKTLLPNQVRFPREALRRLPRGGVYHAGSFDMIVAFAILAGAREIALHGIGLNLESGEPISARACLEYWCGVAEGRGIKVQIAEDCDVFAQYHLVKSNTVYGYDDVKLVEDLR